MALESGRPFEGDRLETGRDMPGGGTGEGPSLRSLVGDLINDVVRLVRDEFRLASAEASEKLSRAQTGLILLIAGLLLAMVALLVLVQALVIALADVMPDWLAAVVVGVVLAAIALAMVSQGRKALRPSNWVPERTLRSLGDIKHAVTERIE